MIWKYDKEMNRSCTTSILNHFTCADVEMVDYIILFNTVVSLLVHTLKSAKWLVTVLLFSVVLYSTTQQWVYLISREHIWRLFIVWKIQCHEST